jgi:catechol 2,3-dioxygenase-like lactoylglutathione lyase family enzyme
MLQHVTLEVAPSAVEPAVEFWRLLGFAEVEAPADLAATFTWLEREGTQIHLMRADAPTVPLHGHVAVVVPDYPETIRRVEEAGFEVSPKRERWGSPRAEAISPGGHRVELMATPPTGGPGA